MWFKKRKKKPKFMIEQQFTIEQIENEIGEKLTYPNQYIKDDPDDDKYKNLKNFGCSDLIFDGGWIHRDCFSGRIKGVCEKCNFYPVKKEFIDKNGLSNNIEDDYLKAFLF